MTREALDVLARTIYGEARSEGWRGQVAVAWVVKNRAARGGWWGHDVISVCRKPYQFSCWNDRDPNKVRCEAVQLAQDVAFRACLAAAAAVLADLEPDPTGGCTHYHTRAVNPRWAIGQTPAVTIGAHHFYRDIP